MQEELESPVKIIYTDNGENYQDTITIYGFGVPIKILVSDKNDAIYECLNFYRKRVMIINEFRNEIEKLKKRTIPKNLRTKSLAG